MNTHNWDTPLIRFKMTARILDFYSSDKGRALRDMFQIKPDKVTGMRFALGKKRLVYVLCRPDQFAYLAVEISNKCVSRIQAELVYPAEGGVEMDTVHSSFSMPLVKDR